MVHTCRRNITLRGAAAAVTAFLVVAPPLMGDDYGYGTAYGTLQWEASDGAVLERGLYLIDNSPYGGVRRVLASDADGEWLAVLTYTLDPLAGKEVRELMDDESGWWARAEIRYGIEEETLAAFFARAGEQLSREDSARWIELKLSTRQGIDESLRIPAAEPDLWAAFARGLSPDQVARLAHDIPASFRPAILFLDDGLADWLSGIAAGAATEPRKPTDLIRVLADALRSTFPQAPGFALESDSRLLTIGPTRHGRGIVEPEILELTARFRSVENADPLARHHVEEVTGAGARQRQD